MPFCTEVRTTPSSARHPILVHKAGRWEQVRPLIIMGEAPAERIARARRCSLVPYSTCRVKSLTE